MYGLIGKLISNQGNRDELIAILLEGTRNMPGCQCYIIAKDKLDENAIWISEVWDNENDHKNSLQLPRVQEAISQGKLLISGFGERFETSPIRDSL